MTLRPPPDSGAALDPMPATEKAAEAVRKAIIALEHDGRLTAEEVVQAARDPGSPLHGCFEWDDAVAAGAHRLEQARALIRSVRVEIVYETQTVAAPRYVRDCSAESDEQGYIAIERLKREPKNARALLRYEFTRAAAHVARAVEIADALGMKSETRAIESGLRAMLRKLE